MNSAKAFACLQCKKQEVKDGKGLTIKSSYAKHTFRVSTLCLWKAHSHKSNCLVECTSIAEAITYLGPGAANNCMAGPKSGRKRSADAMRNFKVTLAYDGTEYSGWQVQPDAATIQGTLASAIGRITGEKVLPQGSGRTDAGVHALAQVASFSIESSIPAENLAKALNDILPSSIRILEVTEVPPEFHARKSARAKTYQYRMHRAPICPPFLARYTWHYPFPLDENAVGRGAEHVLGEHDFTSFAAVDPERRNDEDIRSNIRVISKSEWRRDHDEFVYTVRGNGFLHHMVRNLVGTLMLVGKGTINPDEIAAILRACNRSRAGATAPASGLYLVSVEY